MLIFIILKEKSGEIEGESTIKLDTESKRS